MSVSSAECAARCTRQFSQLADCFFSIRQKVFRRYSTLYVPVGVPVLQWDAEIAGVDDAGVDNDGENCRSRQ